MRTILRSPTAISGFIVGVVIAALSSRVGLIAATLTGIALGVGASFILSRGRLKGGSNDGQAPKQ